MLSQSLRYLQIPALMLMYRRGNLLHDVRYLAAIMKKGIKARYSEKPFEIAGKKFPAGSSIDHQSQVTTGQILTR
jgi:hypothetical protein